MPVQVLCGADRVLLLGFSIYAGCTGPKRPTATFALTFIFVTAWLGFPLFSVIFGDVFRPFNPWRAIGRFVGGAFSTVAGQRPAHLRLPREAGTLAGRDRPARGRLARGRLRRQRRGRGRTLARQPRPRRPHLQPLHAGDDGALRGREVVPDGGDLLGLLRHVLPARQLRSQGRPPGSAPAVVGGDALGDRAGLGRGGDRLDRLDQLRRCAGGRLQERHPADLRMASRSRPQPDHLAAPHRHDLHVCSASPASASST